MKSERNYFTLEKVSPDLRQLEMINCHSCDNLLEYPYITIQAIDHPSHRKTHEYSVCPPCAVKWTIITKATILHSYVRKKNENG